MDFALKTYEWARRLKCSLSSLNLTMKRIIVLTVLSVLVFSFHTFGQNKTNVKDYLSIPGPIKIGGVTHKLSWSSHPTPAYYKQEYIPAGEKLDSFRNMVLVEVLTGETTTSQAAQGKMAELQEMKKTHPLVNYSIFEKKESGEFMLDFLVSANDASGNAIILERNVYRYVPLRASSGKKGLMLLATSTRRYGAEIDAFLSSLKTTKGKLVDELSKLAVPAIKL